MIGCTALVAAKNEAAGTINFVDAAAACTRGVLEEYNKYIGFTQAKIRAAKAGSKKWWRIARGLLHKTGATSSVPSLKLEGPGSRNLARK